MTGRHGYDAPQRQNEYFIPGDGISREVIQADICRYLGNDALVRPGNHNVRIPKSLLYSFSLFFLPYIFPPPRENTPGEAAQQTKCLVCCVIFPLLTRYEQGRQGYFIRAYRNLTTVSSWRGFSVPWFGYKSAVVMIGNMGA